MINKVDGNNYYVYTKPGKVNIADIGEKFSLDYEKDGSQAEIKKRKEISDQEKQQAAEQSGIRIELSAKGVEKQKQAEAMGQRTMAESMPLLERIRTVFTAAAAVIRDFFCKIWETPKQADPLQSAEMTGMGDGQGTDDAGTITVTEIAESESFMDTMGEADSSRTDEVSAANEIRRHLQNGDREQAIRLLTDNGRRTAARNSTLLTFYDRNGRVVRPDASVLQRTLYGDRDTRKL